MRHAQSLKAMEELVPQVFAPPVLHITHSVQIACQLVHIINLTRVWYYVNTPPSGGVRLTFSLSSSISRRICPIFHIPS